MPAKISANIRPTRPGVFWRPSRSGSSPMAASSSRTAASILGWSIIGGASGAEGRLAARLGRRARATSRLGRGLLGRRDLDLGPGAGAGRLAVARGGARGDGVLARPRRQVAHDLGQFGRVEGLLV